MILAELNIAPDRLAIVAHDAGAANHILCWIAAEPNHYRLVLRGPALKLWIQRFGEPPPQVTLEAALNGADCLLTGTGWASDLEHGARSLAREKGIQSIAVIDHWVNYSMRFVRGGEEVLPDRLWVVDEHALARARRVFAGVPAVLKPNLYLAEQVENAGPPPATGDMLFLAEPMRDDWGMGRPGEFQALDYLAACRDAAALDPTVALRIRPHPSDPHGKYDNWIAAHPGSSIDTSRDLAAALRNAKWVIGMQSYALVIAIASGRRAICALPPWAPPNRLPQDELIHLRDFPFADAVARQLRSRFEAV